MKKQLEQLTVDTRWSPKVSQLALADFKKRLERHIAQHKNATITVTTELEPLK